MSILILDTMNKMSLYFDKKFDEINRSEWFINATNALEDLHWYLRRNAKGFKLLFGSGKMRRKFFKITDLYSKNDMVRITSIKNRLIKKSSISVSHYSKTIEIIEYCLFLEQFKSADLITASRLYQYLVEILDTRQELGRLILKKATELKLEKIKYWSV